MRSKEDYSKLKPETKEEHDARRIKEITE